MSRVAAPERCPDGSARAPRTGAGGRAGFTLIEVLVALAVAAACLGAIAQVSGTSARGSRALDAHVGLLQTARAVETGIPARGDLAVGRTDGEVAGHRWRMDVRPLDVGDLPAGARWVPQTVLIRVRAPSGALVTIETVRLVPRGAQ
ncbi:prepilin-type N-terminal cleavage/methylation domain-containing protein [Xanthobacter dioxanivorans]|uniref:Prepilin-type N-terminal cleavage/methylation domain-containing protein n=1 Tax=Xanthobacter dioxanivorans TaxID=2528964 RepID=A0A974PM03_9HYPH|nr:prepilin-type N-terminal cleavage/methylation domain-containing protein [Xanthobacter dioxanivorans]QRG06042.1 prepilin-type N-terminal cleavage/methylation domain-containing protein [Xanthobacter dioxanivorans]